MRQVRRAMNFTEGCKVNLSDISDSENISSILDKTWSHRPDKPLKKRSSGNLPPVRSKRKRSIQCSSFLKILDSFHQHESKMNVISYVKDEASYKVTLNDDGVVRNIEISREFFCSCNKTIRADRKTCRHITWFLNKISLIGLDNDIIGQVYLEDHEIRSLKILDILTESLKEVNIAKRNFHHKIKSHQKFLEKTKWFIGVKSSNTPATCSGCLRKGVIKYSNLHLYTIQKGFCICTNMKMLLRLPFDFV